MEGGGRGLRIQDSKERSHHWRSLLSLPFWQSRIEKSFASMNATHTHSLRLGVRGGGGCFLLARFLQTSSCFQTSGYFPSSLSYYVPLHPRFLFHLFFLSDPLGSGKLRSFTTRTLFTGATSEWIRYIISFLRSCSFHHII